MTRKRRTYSEWLKSVDINDFPAHVLKAWREGWRGWVLVDTKQHDRLYDGYMKSHRLEISLKELKGSVNRKLTWKERLLGKIGK